MKISLEIYYLLSDFIIWVSVTDEYALSFMSSLPLKCLLCAHDYFAKSHCGFWICLENCIPCLKCLKFDTRKLKHPESQIIFKVLALGNKLFFWIPEHALQPLKESTNIMSCRSFNWIGLTLINKKGYIQMIYGFPGGKSDCRMS